MIFRNLACALAAFAASLNAQNLSGSLDAANCDGIYGWAWDANHPHYVAQVEIFEDNTKLRTCTANRFREDLLKARMGDGNHAFVCPLPDSLRDGRPHIVAARIADSKIVLGKSPLTMRCAEPPQHTAANPILFTDPLFLFFFLPIVLTLYLLAPKQWRNLFLVAASLLLYAWGEGKNVFILIASIAINYFAGIAIDRIQEHRLRVVTMWVSVSANILLLIVFKYAAFLAHNINAVLSAVHAPRITEPSIHLPVGISFFTFMGISYLVDVYRRQVAPERNPETFALYISLFPHLVAGPIVRFPSIASSLRRRELSRADFAYGVRRFIVGLAKKLLIANTIAVAADAIFRTPAAQMTAPLAWTGVILFTLEVYFDFSGYSDLAIGLAKMLGFTFPENFNYPYIAQSMRDLWRRWHISLSSWHRDYLYVPLGGSRSPPARNILNIMIVFFLCGLWHGAGWNFVLWGVFQGVFISLEHFRFGALLERFPRPLRHAYVLLVFMIGLVIFRAQSAAQTIGYLRSMFGLGAGDGREFNVMFYLTPDIVFAALAGILACMPWGFAYPVLHRNRGFRLAGACAMLALFIAAATYAAAGTYRPFLYFRF